MVSAVVKAKPATGLALLPGSHTDKALCGLLTSNKINKLNKSHLLLCPECICLSQEVDCGKTMEVVV